LFPEKKLMRRCGMAQGVLVSFNDEASLPILRVEIPDTVVSVYSSEDLIKWIKAMLMIRCPYLILPSSCRYYLDFDLSNPSIDYSVLPIVYLS
jgi:hypothetical protein